MYRFTASCATGVTEGVGMVAVDVAEDVDGVMDGLVDVDTVDVPLLVVGGSEVGV
jgi:hypothetical protein